MFGVTKSGAGRRARKNNVREENSGCRVSNTMWQQVAATDGPESADALPKEQELMNVRLDALHVGKLLRAHATPESELVADKSVSELEKKTKKNS